MPGSAGALRMKTALLIDEDPVVRESLARWLRQAGLAVIEAADGETGRDLALTHKPDLILCDQLAPRCNGFQLCRFLRAQPGPHSGARFVLTASSAYGVDRQGAVEAGADEHIVKPISEQDLARLLEIFRGEGNPAPASLPRPARKDPGPSGPAGGGAIPPGPALSVSGACAGSLPTPGPVHRLLWRQYLVRRSPRRRAVDYFGRGHRHSRAGPETGRGIQGRSPLP